MAMTEAELRKFFHRVVVINLDRRRDRWNAFLEHIQGLDWPFAPPERFSAIDGQVVPQPDWFQQGAGAWACQLSHMRVIEEALKDGTESILVLEDDARFPKNFRERVSRFLSQVPQDWHQIYLGGQHVFTKIQLPMELNSEVLTPYSVGRTHAYAVHHSYYRSLYQKLSDYPVQARDSNAHIDYQMVLLHQAGRYGIFAPHEWLAAQGENQSDISGDAEPTRDWTDTEIRENNTPVVAVIGLHRSGSSCMAGVLHKLGVFMGEDLGGYEESGGFEAARLARLCERAYPFPLVERRVSYRELVNGLLIHIRYVQEAAKRHGTIAGVKYPHLCAMGDELKEVCQDKLRVVHIDRPLEESIASLRTRATKAEGRFRIRDDDAETVQRWLWSSKTAFLSDVDHVTVKYLDLLADPAREIRRVVEFLQIEVDADSFRTAVEHVQPNLRSHRLGESRRLGSTGSFTTSTETAGKSA